MKSDDAKSKHNNIGTNGGTLMSFKQISIRLSLLTLCVLTFGVRASLSADDAPQGWRHTGSRPQDYEMGIDTTVKHGGKASAHIKFIGSSTGGFGNLMQTFRADDYRGKRVRMSAWLKTADANTANLWMRVDGAKVGFGFDNMHNRAVKGTTE
jgi:hypothetical protein